MLRPRSSSGSSVSRVAAMIEPQMLPRPPRTTNTSTRMEVLKSNLAAVTVEKFIAYSVPAMPANAAETTNASSL